MNKRILPSLLLAVLCVIAFQACKKDKTEEFVGDQEFYPVQLGKYVIYNVDSTIYYKDDTSCQQKTLSSQLRYEMADTFYDNLNRLSYVVDVFYRKADSLGWSPLRVAYARRSADSLIFTENGLSYVKMIFPISVGNSWKGNGLIDANDSSYKYLNNWNYTYQNYKQPYSSGLVKYNNTVSILQNEDSQNYPLVDSTLPSYRMYAKEVYAYNVGMVYKEYTRLTQQYKDSCASGFSVIMRAVDHN